MKENRIKGEYLYNYDKVRFSVHTSQSLGENESPWRAPYDTNFISLVYVVSGSLMVYKNDKRYKINQKQCGVLDFRENAPMFTHNDDTAYFYTLDFKPELFGATAKEIKSFEKMFEWVLNINDKKILFPKNLIFEDIDGKILSMFEVVKNEYYERKFMYNDVMRDNVRCIIIEFARHIDDLNLNNTYPDIVQAMLDYCILHYNEELTLSGMSRKFHFSTTHITNMFKKSVGFSFAEYIRQVRMYKAEYLLYISNLNIKEISVKVGYQKVEHFSKLFKEYSGFTPLQYRKLVRKSDPWFEGMEGLKKKKN